MTLLALDIGERRIGLAVGDAPGALAVPVGHLVRTRLKDDVERILDVARERNAEGIVVGIPYSVGGEVGPQAKRVQGFIRHLKNTTTLSVFTVDERFTSFEAQGLLRDAGHQPSRRKGSIDASAATLTLQRFLDQSRTQPS